jgi:hypothetical protein
MILDTYNQDLPGTMTSRPQWMALMSGFAALIDCFIEGVFEAEMAAMPGQQQTPGVPGLGGFDSVDALVGPVCRQRGIVVGLLESIDSIAMRCRRWRDDWTRAGTVPGLLEQLAAVLSPDPPILRVVTRSGVWWTRNTDGSFTLQTAAGLGFTYSPATGAYTGNTDVAHVFDWDSITVPAPPDQNDGTEFYVIGYMPANVPYLASDDGVCPDPGEAGDYWNDPSDVAPDGDPNAGTVGTTSPIQHVELVRRVIYQRRAAGFRCAYIVWSEDPDAFNPTGDSTPTSIPDGTWGYDHSLSTGLPTRFPNARYWPGVPGGEH